jgi:hypothetical protein
MDKSIIFIMNHRLEHLSCVTLEGLIQSRETEDAV